MSPLLYSALPHARRPSSSIHNTRLGVGAPIPETHAPAQARLVQKLQGGKNRARKAANGAHADVMGVKKKEDEEEESMEESRISTTRKRMIIDPFEAAGKKGKKRRREAEEIKDGTDGTAQVVPQTVDDEIMVDAFGATAGPTPKKKKKKKTSILPEGQGTAEHNSEPWYANTHNAVVAQNEGPLMQTPPDTWEAKKLLPQEFRVGAAEASDTGMLWLVLQRFSN